MKRIVWMLLVCEMLTQVAAGGASRDASKSVLLRISDWDAYLTPTMGPNNVGNCLIVYADGRLHLELRRQEFFFGKANYSSYEGALSKQDLASVYSILENADVRKLPEPRYPPEYPSAATHTGWFTAEIYREGVIQKVGYPVGQLKPAEDDDAAWDQQRAALQPLVQWSRATKSFNHVGWRKVHNANSVCQP